MNIIYILLLPKWDPLYATHLTIHYVSIYIHGNPSHPTRPPFNKNHTHVFQKWVTYEDNRLVGFSGYHVGLLSHKMPIVIVLFT